MSLLEREKKYPMIFDIPILLCLSTQMSLTSHFCYAEAYRCNLWLAGNSGEMVINAFLSGFLVLPVKKSDMSVKNKRQLNLTHHKQEAQEIQSLENFVSMAIQGT